MMLQGRCRSVMPAAPGRSGTQIRAALSLRPAPARPSCPRSTVSRGPCAPVSQCRPASPVHQQRRFLFSTKATSGSLDGADSYQNGADVQGLSPFGSLSLSSLQSESLEDVRREKLDLRQQLAAVQQLVLAASEPGLDRELYIILQRQMATLLEKEERMASGASGTNAKAMSREELQDVIMDANRQLLARPGAMGTTSYEQYFAGQGVVTQDIRKLGGGMLAPVPEDVALPTLSGKNVDENVVMLPNFMAALQGLQSTAGADGPKYLVLDTHMDRYLDGCAPDITLVKPGSTVSSFNVACVIELQRGDLDNRHRGKAVKYCQLMLDAHPDRQLAMCLLTNTEVLEVFQMRRESPEVCRTFQSNPVQLLEGGDGWRFITGLVRHTSPAALGCDVPQFTLGGQMYEPTRLLGTGRGVSVYQVQDGDRAMACKVHDASRARSFARELAALTAIAGKPLLGALPRLVEYDSNQRVLLTEPVAQPLVHLTFRQLDSLVQTLVHIHTELQMVHRDVEPKHLGITKPGGELCLLDFGSAAFLPSPQTELEDLQLGMSAQHLTQRASSSLYSGTLLFASDDVLTALRAGQPCPPHPRQDLVALVKTVYTLIHASAADAVSELAMKVGRMLEKGDPVGLAAAVDAIRAFWDAEMLCSTPAGVVWRSLLDTAHKEVPNKASYHAVIEVLLPGLGRMLRAAG